MDYRRLSVEVWLCPMVLILCLSGAYCRPCPEGCSCTFNEYQCANGTLTFLLGANDGLKISCEGTTPTCSDFPIINLQFTKMTVISCPANIFMCITDPLVLDQPMIQNLLLFNISGTLEEDYVRNFTYLQKMEMELLDDTLISTAAINSLRHLTVLELLYGKFQLSETRFNNTSLQDLLLFGTVIDNLHTEAFNGLPNLKILRLENINIGNISVGFFKGLDSLEKLKLKNNNLKIIEAGVFADTPKLVELYTFNNPLISLPDHLISGLTLLKKLQIICSDDDYLTDGTAFHLGTHAFTDLPALELIYINNCLKHKLAITSKNNSINASTSEGSQMLQSRIIYANLPSLKTVELFSNSINTPSDTMFTNSSALEIISLWKNEIKELPENIFHNLTALIKLDLSDNYIKKLYDGMFSDLAALNVLNLAHNAIEELTLNVFHGLNNLTVLYLQNNNIMDIEELHDNAGTLPRFGYLTNLHRINFNNNKISRIGFLKMLPRIETMNFANNRFKDVWDFKDIYSSKNVTIDLSNNYISEVFLDFGRNWNDINRRLFNLNHINLDRNPIFCDCSNYDLYLCASDYTPNCETTFILGSSECSGPPHLKGRLVTALSPNDLVCDLQYVCPENCTCIFRPATVEVILTCNDIPTTLPVFPLDIEREYYPMRYHRDYTYTLNFKTQSINLTDLNIHTLNLSNAELINITFKPNDHLKTLDISHNNLTTVPDAILKTNITLYVADNPLECDCALVEGLTEHRVADYRLVYCANGEALSNINAGRLCRWQLVLFGYVCLALMAAIFVLKMAITMRRYIKRKRFTISKIFRRGSDFSINMERNLDIAKEYDLFISFAHQDTEFVRDNLLPKLENEFRQSVCVHHRDWVAGELIEDQIIKSVESARRTVIILTEAFIQSEWSYLEFRNAHNTSIREGRPRVIMILLNEEIKNDERLSKAIKSYITVNSYLVWGDPDFWEKIKRVLPKRRR